ncbi:hypothetical protein GCM10025778_03260 [Paeniglutamicibacter antarcticus]|uniref:MFS transporter n=1 Tax=Paeniglutamicibacter antarcticus TaxID=494023 RepID=A0ABP9TI13_9MICC
MALAVLAGALALIVLDGTIVGVSLPSMIQDLDMDLTQAQWINSLYSVVLAALLMTAGRLGTGWDDDACWPWASGSSFSAASVPHWPPGPGR